MKLLEDTGGIFDRPKSGRLRVVRTPQAIKAMKARIDRKSAAEAENLVVGDEYL